MKPVGGGRINELARIVSPSDHGCADDVSQVPRLQNPSESVHFNVHRVVVGCGIRIQDNSNLLTVDVMVKISNSETAVIGKESESAIELDSRQLVAMTQIGCVIKEDDTSGRDASRAHPPQCAIRVDNGRFEIATRPFNHDVVVAQIGVICTCFQDRRIVISARIIESSGRDSDVSLLRGAVHKPISERNDVTVSIVKSVDWQDDLAGLRVFKASIYEVRIGISG